VLDMAVRENMKRTGARYSLENGSVHFFMET